MGFGVWGLELRVSGFGFRVWVVLYIPATPWCPYAEVRRAGRKAVVHISKMCKAVVHVSKTAACWRWRMLELSNEKG